MKAVNLRIEPFECLQILEFQMELTVNDHGSAVFTGYIPPKEEESYLKMSLEDTWCPVYAKEEGGKEEIVFYGVVTNLRIRSEEGLKCLTVELKTGSYLLDQSSHIRSFQKKGSSYRDCLDTLLPSDPNQGILMTVGEYDPIPDFLLQFQETDWQFAKRLASHHHSPIVPEYRTPGRKFYFGIPERLGSWDLKETSYQGEKRMEESIWKRKNGLLVSEKDTLCYRVVSREFHDLAKRVFLNGQALLIESVQTKWERGEWVHSYILRPAPGFLMVTTYNQALTGASLEGRILSVKADSVKVRLGADENRDSGERWFPYSTVYSSPDGSGWFCMPEIGDSIRLYLPGEKEHHAYVVSSVHREAGDGISRSNPDFKTIRTKDGKEVTFEPGRIYMTNHKGMSIEISDKEGIKIESEKEISISSKSSLGILSQEEKLEFHSPNEIGLNQGENQLRLKENAILNGSKINLQ